MTPEQIDEQLAKIEKNTGHSSVWIAHRSVVIDYTNWRGERSERVIMPIRVEFTATKWHPEAQWLVEAHCGESGTVKSFAMAGMNAPWKEALS